MKAWIIAQTFLSSPSPSPNPNWTGADTIIIITCVIAFILAQVKEENLQCVGQKSNFLDLADLDFDFLSNFFPRSRCSCAHLKGNFLNFPKLNLLLSVVHLQGSYGHLNTNPTFFGTPCRPLVVRALKSQEKSLRGWVMVVVKTKFTV